MRTCDAGSGCASSFFFCKLGNSGNYRKIGGVGNAVAAGKSAEWVTRWLPENRRSGLVRVYKECQAPKNFFLVVSQCALRTPARRCEPRGREKKKNIVTVTEFFYSRRRRHAFGLRPGRRSDNCHALFPPNGGALAAIIIYKLGFRCVGVSSENVSPTGGRVEAAYPIHRQTSYG